MTLEETKQAIADALEPLAEEIPGLQIYAGWNPNPTPPSIDIYEGDPFMTDAGFGPGNVQVFWTIRARVSTADVQAGDRLLTKLLEPLGATSVQYAVEFDDTAVVVREGISGKREYNDAQSSETGLLGCEWRVSTFL